MNDPNHREEIVRERENLLDRIQAWLEIPMLLLSTAWLVLLVIEMVRGLGSLLQAVVYAIWVIFIIDFLMSLALAPRKLQFVRSNWLSAIALVIPAFRLFRVVTLVRFAGVAKTAGVLRGVRVLRVITSINRGMASLGSAMQRRGFGYVVLLTVMVTFAGAAAMYRFENENPAGPVFDSYGTALWWTAMIMTTMGSDYWPQTAEGRALCLFLAVYSFTVFGYVTATLASYFIGRDAENEEAEIAGVRSITALREEIAALRDELRSERRRDAEEDQARREQVVTRD